MDGLSNHGFLRLTILNASDGEDFALRAADLLAYRQQEGCTRLWLLGRKTMNVRETTDEIDRRVREAATEVSHWE